MAELRFHYRLPIDAEDTMSEEQIIKLWFEYLYCKKKFNEVAK
jgi:hypothetical protein